MDLEQRIWRRFQQALVEYRLTEEGDHILVGLSGGKDSLCLLELLARRARIRKPAIQVEALHVRMERPDMHPIVNSKDDTAQRSVDDIAQRSIDRLVVGPGEAVAKQGVLYETDTQWLQDFCDRVGVRLHIRTARFDAPNADAGQREKPACFLCSWMRRKQLFNVAQELGCNKIALGHHQDDIIHTALMNLSFQGHFSTMPARLQMRKMPLTIIRPLCLNTEADIQALANLRGYRKQQKLCPFERDTHRTTMRHVFEQLEALNSETRHSIWNALAREGKLVEDAEY